MYKLTGKCKEDFLNHYWENNIKPLPMTMCKREDLESFFDSIFELCQNALIVEWFDSVGIFIDCGYYAKGKMCSGVEGVDLRFISTGIKHENRTEAINSAIYKAKEIYNAKDENFDKPLKDVGL